MGPELWKCHFCGSPCSLVGTHYDGEEMFQISRKLSKQSKLTHQFCHLISKRRPLAVRPRRDEGKFLVFWPFICLLCRRTGNGAATNEVIETEVLKLSRQLS